MLRIGFVEYLRSLTSLADLDVYCTRTKLQQERVSFACPHVLAGGGDALEEFEVVVRFHAALLYPLAQHVKRRQVARAGSVQNRHHHLRDVIDEARK